MESGITVVQGIQDSWAWLQKVGLDDEGHNLAVFHIGFPRLPNGVVKLMYV